MQLHPIALLSVQGQCYVSKVNLIEGLTFKPDVVALLGDGAVVVVHLPPTVTVYVECVDDLEL